MEEVKERLITYTPKATPYSFRVPVTSEELTLKLDEVWDRDKERLSKLYKGKKKKGGSKDFSKARKAIEKSVGFATLYNQDLAEWGRTLIEDEFGSAIILVNTVNIVKTPEGTDPEETFLELDVYTYPEAKLTEDKKEVLRNFKMPKKDLPSEEEALKQRVDELQKTQMTREPVETVEDGCEVVFDIYTSIEGTRYENGCVKLRRAEFCDITPIAVKDSLMGRKKGDRFTVSFASPFEDEYKDQMVDAEIIIQDVCKLIPMDPGEEGLYVKAGFESAAAFEAEFKEQYKEYCDKAVKEETYSQVIQFIIKSAELGPIPERFIEMRLQGFLGMDKKKDHDQQTIQMVYQQILNQVVDKMASYCYVDLFELDRSIEHDDLVKFMMDKTTYE